MFKWLLGWQPTIMVFGIAVATATVVGGYGGYKIAAWRCKADQLALTQQYNKHLEETLTEYAAKARADQARAVLAAMERQATSSRAQEVIHETTTDPGDAACERRDTQRMRIDRHYQTFGYPAAQPAK